MKKEFNFYTHPWESFMFFDIETVAKVPELQENTDLYNSFVYKMRYAEEAQRKDFNAYNVKALFAEKAALYPEFGKIVCISVGKIVDGKLVIHTFKDKDEKTLLIKFNTFLQDRVSKDPRLALCGVNLKFFDLRYVFIRSIVHQVTPVMGQINLSGLKPWEVQTADITDIWKQTSPYNAPLACMTECLGLPSPKTDLDGSQVSKVYWTEGDAGLERIASYCEDDILASANVARMLRLDPILEVANKEETKVAEKKQEEEKPLSVLEKMYMTNSFTKEMEAEINKLIGKKKLTKMDKENLRTILLGVLLRTDFINMDQDNKDIKAEKIQMVDEYINTLK